MFYSFLLRPLFPVAAISGNYEDQYVTAELELLILRIIVRVNDLKCKWSKHKNHAKGNTHKMKLNVLNKKREGGEKCYIYRYYRKLCFVYTSGTIILSGVQ